VYSEESDAVAHRLLAHPVGISCGRRSNQFADPPARVWAEAESHATATIAAATQ